MAQVVQVCPKARDHLSPDGPQLDTNNVSATYVVTSLGLRVSKDSSPHFTGMEAEAPRG